MAMVQFLSSRTLRTPISGRDPIRSATMGIESASDRMAARRAGRVSLVCRALAIFFAAFLAFPAAAQDTGAADPPEKPNILFILTDDQAPWALGAEGHALAASMGQAMESAPENFAVLGAGHPNLRTPHMNRLAAEGAFFSNAFVATPVCSPSRAELMTGRYGSEVDIWDWINPQREVGHGLDPGLLTWVDLLNQEGYATGLIGKWHLGTQDRYHPTTMGYDSFFGFRGGGIPPRDAVLEENGVTAVHEGFPQNILTDRAIEFLREHREGPFMLSLHYRAPHAAWLPLPEEDWAPYDGLDPVLPNPDYPQLDTERLRRYMPEYLAAVASIDRNLGRILEVLDELGLTDHTIVVFTSDHGYNMGHNGIWHKGNGHWILTDPPPGTYHVPQGQRPNMYDNSLKVPLLVRWPGVTAPGTVVESIVSNLDWYATLAEMGGADVPAGVLLRGRSFVPLLRGNTPEDWPTELYAEYSTHHQSWTHMRAYRTPEWKLVRDLLDARRDELFNLAEDPAESVNLIAEDTPEVRTALEYLDARLVERMTEIDDPVLPLAARLTR